VKLASRSRRPPGVPVPAWTPQEAAEALGRINRAAEHFFATIEAAIGAETCDAANRARQQARLEIDRAAQWAMVGLFESLLARGGDTHVRPEPGRRPG
jgi:hypothetical protein